MDGKVYNHHAVDPVSKETSVLSWKPHSTQQTNHLQLEATYTQASTGRWENAHNQPSPEENVDT